MCQHRRPTEVDYGFSDVVAFGRALQPVDHEASCSHGPNCGTDIARNSLFPRNNHTTIPHDVLSQGMTFMTLSNSYLTES